MNSRPHRPAPVAAILMGLLLTIVGCGPAAPGRSGSLSPEREGRRPNVLRIALAEDVPQLSQRLGNTVSTVNPLVNGYLARTDGNGVVWPDLLEKLPSRDEGTWIVNPDGTIQMILTLRLGLKSVKSLSVGGSSSYLWNVWEWRLE